jgi:uncharacterized membrane protein YidH (DUF202 family)
MSLLAQDRRAPDLSPPVLLGFSLLFLRFWTFEAPGKWTKSTVIATVLLVLAIGLQLIALWRSLQIADDDEIEYAKTLKWFFYSALALMISVVIAALALEELLGF